jgi:hypothetical protein
VKTWCASGHWFTPALDTPTVQPTVTHAIVEPPGDQYGTWAKGTSAVPHALGQPNLLHTASPILGAFSVAVSSLLSLAVLAALVLLTREARANQLRPAGRER